MPTQDSKKGNYPSSGHYPEMGGYPGSGQYSGMAMEEGLSIQEIFGTLWRRKIPVVLLAGLTALAVLGYSVMRMPSYQSSARILLEDNAPSSGLLGEISALTGSPPAAAEMEVVKSREILKRLVALPEEDSLGLGLVLRVDDLDRYQPLSTLLAHWKEDAPTGSLSAKLVGSSAVKTWGSALLQIGDNQKAGLTWMNAEKEKQEIVFPWRKQNTLSVESLTLELTAEGNLAGRRFRLTWTTPRDATDRLLGSLSVSETTRGSGVLKIALSDSDPFRAAEIVNQVVRSYMERSRERLALRAKTTVSYIEEQIERIQGELEEAEKALVEYQEREGAALLTDAARAVVERISSLDLEQAKLAMLIEGQDQLVQAMDKGRPAEELGAGIELDIQTASLLQELSVLRSQESLLADEHQDAWPPLMQVRAQIAQVRQTISGAAKSRAGALHKRSDSIQGAVDRWQAQLNTLPATERELAKFQRKAESFESIYTFLLAQEQQARISEKASIAAVSVVDWAVPALSRSSPRLVLMTGVGLLLGLFLGTAFALWRESTQKTVLSAAQLEAVTGLPQWGIIPDFLKGGGRAKGASSKEYFLALRDAPDSSVAESYRSLRANFRFAAKGQEIKTLTITSAAQGEGKSTTIADLAIALANGGSNVLLVDADLRRPVIHRMFSCAQSPGLAEALQGQEDWTRTVVTETGIENLSVIPAGKAKGKNPGDLLALPEVVQLVDDLKEAFDYVLFDVPPVLAVADATSFLNHLDALLFLTRYNYSPEAAVAGATQRLKISGAEPLGCVLNSVRTSRVGGYGYGSYGSYGRSNRA